MSASDTRETTPRNIQGLMLKRFGMAAITYAFVLVLLWVSLWTGIYSGSTSAALASSIVVLISQLVFWGLFRSGYNLRFKDPSLTQAQIIVGIALQTGLLAQLEGSRGSLFVVYVIILMFGMFQLPGRVFVRCAALAFCSFTALLLWEFYQQHGDPLGEVLLQLAVLFITLVWLCLFAHYAQRLRSRMRQRTHVLRAHQDTLRGMMSQLESLAATDELTGLFNRRHFLRLAGEVLAQLRPGRQHGLAIVDLDFFKKINDLHGHAVGDRVLQGFARVATSCMREGDVLARYGGEEFVLLLPHTDASQLARCCERLRQAFAALSLENGAVTGLSLSVGMAVLKYADDLEGALNRADKALYQAKRAGRNRCAAAWDVERV